MRYTRILVLLGILSITSFGNAQESPEFIKYKNAYPDEYLARLTSQRLIDISLKDNQIKISQTIEEEDLLLNETAQFATEESVEYSSFFLLDKIEAASLVYDGKKYREYEVTDFVRKDELSESFYDDTKSVNFLYPKLQQGAIKKLNYTTSITNPRFLSPVYFGNVYPLVKQKVEIVVDKDINLRFKKFNMEGVDVRFRESEKRGRKIYTWELENQDAYDLESNGPSPKTILPHIIPIISSYEDKNEEVPVLNGVKDLYNWYYSLIKDINQEELDDELVAITNDLIASKTSEIDKVKAIYYWVQENIKYIDFEYALGGFIPRDANAVFQKKFGDCKDNSSILKEMFKIANIKGNLTWLGTRSIPYSYEDVPTPAADNHMILTYENEGETYFLDATGRYLPLEIPSSFIQGKEALIENGEGDYKIVKVPIVPADQNLYSDVVNIKLDGNSIKGNGTLTLTGYQKSNTFNYIENRDTQEKLLEYYNSFLRKGSNRFLVENFEEKNKYSYEKPFEVEYNFTIKDYAQSLNDEIFINLNLYKTSINAYKIKEDRKTNIEFKYRSEDSITVVFEIPEGKEVTYLPEDVSVDNDFMSASISYKKEGTQIIYTHAYKTKKLILEKDTHEAFRKSLKKINKAFKEVVVLK
ncbi:transglutaminase domain-containing protein [uncultured Dokdonia sp.]|uniref:transglutaminase domain-containing protein n=1 Tax=uncultured Dokdonia sp. TaxID=575653 RepID=UPI00261ADB6C|nr:transglutaminase domain-containing protein [uncultured Dokdonia sp.]